MESSHVGSRGNWTSRFGFILAAAGSAIGLGNIWRFPYTAGQYGGGAFVLVYLLFVAMIGVPVLLSELSLGRATEKNAVGAFKDLVPGSWWPVVGGLGVLTGFGILSFYSVIAGWTLSYAYMAARGEFSNGLSGEESNAVFTTLTSNGGTMVFLTAIFMLLTALVVRRGISGGIERAAKILMPVFFFLLVLLVVRSVTLEGAGEGLEFLFHTDFSELTAAGVVSALGQALFSLSIGMGAMITYGSYLSRDENLPSAGLTVALFDTGIALVAGLMIFPALFHAGAEPTAGPGLVFVVMPTIFGTLPALPTLFAVGFYGLLAIAALTSTISLLEVIVAYFVDERGWRRERAVWTITAACLVLAVPSALSNGAVPALSNLPGGGFLGLCSIIFGNYFLSIGAVFICVFVGWRWGIPQALAEMRRGSAGLLAGAFWGFLVRYVCPVAVVAVLVYAAWTGSYF